MVSDEKRFCNRIESEATSYSPFRFRFDLDNGNLTRIHNTDGGGEDYNMEFDALNRLVRYYEDTASEKGIFSYNCAGLLAAREVDGDITKFGYDVHNVLDMITKANGDELGFDFDMLGRLRGYDTDTRESTFNYDGTKRFGDFDDGWKRYHWCKSQFLGYEDDTNTFYIVPDINGSTKVIFTHAGTIVNRLDYDSLGKIRNQDTTPQVELLWRGMFLEEESDFYYSNGIYAQFFGKVLLHFSKATVHLPVGIASNSNNASLCDVSWDRVRDFFIGLLIPWQIWPIGPRSTWDHWYNETSGADSALGCAVARQNLINCWARYRACVASEDCTSFEAYLISQECTTIYSPRYVKACSGGSSFS